MRFNPIIKPQKKERLQVSVLSLDERHGWYHPKLVQFIASIGPWARKYEIFFNPANQVVFAAGARNLLAKQMLKTDCDWLMMCDNDVAPQTDILDMLDEVTDEMDVVLPLCHIWHGNTGTVMTVLRPLETQTNEPQDLIKRIEDLPRWMELEAAGTGCIFIRRRVFEGMGYPYFTYTFDENHALRDTEDIVFSREARKAGFRIWGHTRYLAAHHHTCDLSRIPMASVDQVAEMQRQVETEARNGQEISQEV